MKNKEFSERKVSSEVFKIIEDRIKESEFKTEREKVSCKLSLLSFMVAVTFTNLSDLLGIEIATEMLKFFNSDVSERIKEMIEIMEDKK